MIKILNEYPATVLAVSAEGKITASDYETILMPAVAEKLKSNKKIRLLYYLGNNFSGFDLSAMLDDAKMGMKHLSAWEKIALVPDHELINTFAKFFGYIMPGEVRIFKDHDFENAKKWIIE